MRLAFVSDFYYPSIGGTQMLCKGIAEWFHKQGHDIEIITSPDSSRKDLGYVVNEINGLSFENSNILLEKNYDVVFVLADLFSPSILSMNPGESKKSILILNLDENVYRWIHEGKIKDIERRIEKIKNFSHVVSFCQGAPVNKFLEENKIKYHFIPNFSRDVIRDNKSDKITKQALGINKKIIFNHGLIETRKNQLNLIKAFESSSLSDEYHLVLLGSPRSYGDNRYFLECKKLADKNKNITMIKGTNNKIVINSLLSISDVYVLPSIAEGLPLVLLEAMSAGLPWVSTPVGGVPVVFGSLDGGKVMSSFDLSELESSIKEVEHKNSRSDWESNFTIDRAGQQYQELLSINTDYKKEIELLKKHKISFANQVYNEPEAIKNYLNSCLQFDGIIDEVFVINHRSTDNTLEVIKSFEDRFKLTEIKFHWKTEKRDFSKNFTHGDLRTNAVSSCENEIVFNHDADFVFGHGFLRTMSECITAFKKEEVYAASYEVPVVSGDLIMENNVVKDYSWCNVHVHVPRVVKKSKAICLQKHVGGKYEWWYPKDPNSSKWHRCNYYRNSILSIENKNEARLQLRKTMNTYFEDLYSGKVKDSWLSCKDLRAETEIWSVKNNTNNKIANIKEDNYEF